MQIFDCLAMLCFSISTPFLLCSQVLSTGTFLLSSVTKMAKKKKKKRLQITFSASMIKHMLIFTIAFCLPILSPLLQTVSPLEMVTALC